MADIRLTSVAKNFKGLSHQIAALNWLNEQVPSATLSQFSEMWRADPPVKPEASPTPGQVSNPLKVPYFTQTNDGPEGWRHCQTSSIAMCLAFMGVKGIKDDLDYLAVVQRHGDTTSQAAHAAALAEIGVRAKFRQNMTAGELMTEIKGGRPCAIGLLHHGPVNAPTGGGHYVTVIGFTADTSSWVIHDPYGELDLVNGTWARQGGISGQSQCYSFRNMNPRWLPSGPASGWGWRFC